MARLVGRRNHRRIAALLVHRAPAAERHARARGGGGGASAVGAGAVPAPPTRVRACARRGAFLAGLAIGVRSQTAALTLPLLALAIAAPSTGVTRGRRRRALAAAAGGVLLWAVPLLVASGGPEAYLAALSGQAEEDFAGTSMLWTLPNPRAVADALTYSFLWPWGGVIAGGIVLALAAAGAIRLGWCDRRAFAVLAVAFGPYAVFHLLFHETATVRYALPLVPGVAYLAVHGLQSMGRATATVGATAIVTASLAMAVPAGRAYAEGGSPTFRLLEDLAALSDDSRSSQPLPEVIGMHAVTRRAQEWTGSAGTPLLGAPHGHEWLRLVDHWRERPESPAFFIADPRRTDLALFDRHARQLIEPYRWGLPTVPYLGGVRPGAADLYAMRPPRWMLGQGWALTPEIAGVSARHGAGPHVQPTLAWVRGSEEPALLAIGGRNLGAEAGSVARVTLARATATLDSWSVPPGSFFRVIPLPPGSLSGEGYLPLRVTAAGDRSGRPVRVALEQFDLQPDGMMMSGFSAGWHEPEFSPSTTRQWRWMSERAVFWVRPVGRDVTLSVTGESPLRYFDRPPMVRISLGARELARFNPAADFRVSAALPADLLSAADGRVLIESDRWFSPADRGEADRRHLALRVYSVEIR
jgi:hypothetical protein